MTKERHFLLSYCNNTALLEIYIPPIRHTRHRTKLCKRHSSLLFVSKPVTFQKLCLPASYCRDQSQLLRLRRIPGVFLISSNFLQVLGTALPTPRLVVHQPWPELRISNGNRTEWSSTRTVIIRVMTKSDDRAAGVRFIYHKYDYILTWTTQSLFID